MHRWNVLKGSCGVQCWRAEWSAVINSHPCLRYGEPGPDPTNGRVRCRVTKNGRIKQWFAQLQNELVLCSFDVYAVATLQGFVWSPCIKEYMFFVEGSRSGGTNWMALPGRTKNVRLTEHTTPKSTTSNMVARGGRRRPSSSWFFICPKQCLSEKQKDKPMFKSRFVWM